MCLYSRTPIPSIAQEDIYCYKKLIKDPYDKYSYLTPYRRECVTVPGTVRGRGRRVVHPSYGSCTYTISEGFIHAYTKKFLRIIEYRPYNIALAKIPKGAKYYIDLNGEEICATEMKLIKII